MLISHKNKFIIINIQKTGTKSLRQTLVPLNVIDLIGKPLPLSAKIKFRQHGFIKEVISGFEEEGWNFNEYFKYGFVRNPWDRYFSFYTYYKDKLKFYQETNIELNDNQQRQKINAFCLFKNKTYEEVFKSIILKFPPHINYFIDNSGNMVMDEIGQLENITGDFNGFCKKVNISPIPKLLHENKSDKVSVKKDNLYTQELIDIVAEKEKWVIDKFGYDFN